jgi:hypothetical protein
MQEAGPWPHNQIIGSPEPAYALDFPSFFGPAGALTTVRTREFHHLERGVPLPTATIPFLATLGRQPLPARSAAGYRLPHLQRRLSPRPAIRQPTKPPRRITALPAAVPPRRSSLPREAAFREPANRILCESLSFPMRMPTNLKLSPLMLH